MRNEELGIVKLRPPMQTPGVDFLIPRSSFLVPRSSLQFLVIRELRGEINEVSAPCRPLTPARLANKALFARAVGT
jgi:hypothetical protein